MPAVSPSFIPIQQESIQYNQPVSESANSAIASLANGLLNVFFPVGSIVDSMLTEAQFQAQIGSSTIWILADGRNIAGSGLANLYGSNICPDLRGIFTRGKNNGTVSPFNNPDGEIPLGQYSPDKFLSHTHNYTFAGPFITVGSGSTWSPAFPGTTQPTSATGGNETAPKNITVNKFIRIN